MEIDTFVGEGKSARTGGGVENWLAVVDAGLCGCARGHSWVQLESRDSRSCSLFLWKLVWQISCHKDIMRGRYYLAF
ncbi:hypothetical protein ACSBR2_016031 [Camellia fascicularis]